MIWLHTYTSYSLCSSQTSLHGICWWTEPTRSLNRPISLMWYPEMSWSGFSFSTLKITYFRQPDLIPAPMRQCSMIPRSFCSNIPKEKEICSNHCNFEGAQHYCLWGCPTKLLIMYQNQQLAITSPKDRYKQLQNWGIDNTPPPHVTRNNHPREAGDTPVRRWSEFMLSHVLASFFLEEGCVDA